MSRVSVLIYRSMAFGAARRWRYGRLSRCAEMRGSVEARWAWPFTLPTSGRDRLDPPGLDAVDAATRTQILYVRALASCKTL